MNEISMFVTTLYRYMFIQEVSSFVISLNNLNILMSKENMWTLLALIFPA